MRNTGARPVFRILAAVLAAVAMSVIMLILWSMAQSHELNTAVRAWSVLAYVLFVIQFASIALRGKLAWPWARWKERTK